MALNQQLRSRAIRGFEERLKVLSSERTWDSIKEAYLRDLRTILAILRDDPKKTELVKNLPE